mgnify:FL=1
MMKAIGSLFTLAGETLSAIGRMIERPAFNDEAAEQFLGGRWESDGPDAADALADFEERTEVHEPKFCQHCNSYGIHLRSCSTSPGASSVSQPAAAAVPGEAVGAVESPSSGDGADWPLGELLKESGRLLWAYGIGEASEYTMHLAMQLRTAALRISDTE